MVKSALTIAAVLLLGYPIAWVLASRGILGDVEFGYYRGFNVVRHAIERSKCAASIEFGGVNKDIVLEEFHFKVTSRSGRVIRLWFDDSNMEVRRLCSNPAGVVVFNRNGTGDTQVYSIRLVSELLNKTGISSDCVADILCNIDEFREALRTADGDANDVQAMDPYCWDYLRIDLPSEQDLRPFIYVNVKKWNLLGWPP